MICFNIGRYVTEQVYGDLFTKTVVGVDFGYLYVTMTEALIFVVAV